MSGKKRNAGIRILSALLVFALMFSCCWVTAAAISVGAPVGEIAADAADAADGGGFLDFLAGIDLLGLFKDLFFETINDWISGIVNSAFALVDKLMLDLIDVTFHAENLVNSGSTTAFSGGMISDVYAFLYLLACSLVTLKFLFKGFQIYILWRNGDADSSPRDMMIGVAEAAAMMVSFPYLYSLFVDVVIWVAQEIMGRLGVASYAISLSGIIGSSVKFGAWSEVLVSLLFALLYFIFVLILWIKMVSQGFELFVLRMGVPLATLGLIDSDMAMFKAYMQVFIKLSITTIIQVCLMSLSFRVIANFEFLSIVSAIALLYAALSTPKLLQQFLIPRSGGGIAAKAHSAAMVLRAAKMLFV